MSTEDDISDDRTRFLNQRVEPRLDKVLIQSTTSPDASLVWSFMQDAHWSLAVRSTAKFRSIGAAGLLQMPSDDKPRMMVHERLSIGDTAVSQ